MHAEAEERLGLASDAMADKTALDEERKRTELAHHAVHAAQRELRECQVEIEDLKANLTQVGASLLCTLFATRPVSAVPGEHRDALCCGCLLFASSNRGAFTLRWIISHILARRIAGVDHDDATAP